MILLELIIKCIKMGKVMWVVFVDFEVVQLVGINFNYMILFMFVLGFVMVGVVGVLIGLYYNLIDLLMGMMFGIKVFVVVVIGGIGFVFGVLLGGFIIGILEIGVQVIGLFVYKDVVVYFVLIVILFVLLVGIFGK